MKLSKLKFPKVSTLVKKNLELVYLICTALIVIISVQVFNFIKDQKRSHFFEILNNIYFEKTLSSVINNLEPRYVNIEHKVLYGESFSSILENYEIPKREINITKKLFIKKQKY